MTRSCVTASISDQLDQLLRDLVEHDNQPEATCLKRRVQVGAEVGGIHNLGLGGLAHNVNETAAAEAAGQDVPLELLDAETMESRGVCEYLGDDGAT